MSPEPSTTGITRRRSLQGLAALATVASGGLLSACAGSGPAPHKPHVALSGVLRLWGHGQRDGGPALPLVEAWARSFNQRWPDVRIEHQLRGDSTAIGGLYTGVADLALMLRPPLAIELDGYQPIIGNQPFAVPVATGGFDSAAHAPAVVACVQAGHPLRQLSLAQLDALLSADRRRGHGPVTRWGDLGVEGPCRDQPVRLLLPDLGSEVTQWLQHAVMAGGQKWVGDLRELGDPGAPAFARRLAQALRDEPCAVAIATTAQLSPGVRALALSADGGAAVVVPTPASVASRHYPLVRTLSLHARRPKGRPLEPLVAAFLHHVLGAQGQTDVAQHGHYFALPTEVTGQALERLS